MLARTPLIPPPAGPATFELAPMAGPSRPMATRTRTVSSLSLGGRGRRGYASDKGQKELYSDELGSTGAGTDDVAHSDAAYDKDANPQRSAQKVEKETGKDFTQRSPANPASSQPHQQGNKQSDAPFGTSNKPQGR
ncbi:hypothetical protein M231_00164 [Tremella mesenterica]|uniref:Uncharacterized protein n=2 Tax=Tremella mesenterica TaxID=5217 RepID=A0A4Q1BWS7_TREME|nr:hypothetical protein M231_00164 [Tremella mesenterica]